MRAGREGRGGTGAEEASHEVSSCAERARQASASLKGSRARRESDVERSGVCLLCVFARTSLGCVFTVNWGIESWFQCLQSAEVDSMLLNWLC